MIKKIQKIDLVILVGGYGSRISKYTKKIPKPIIKINNRNFLSYIINHYSKYCFNNIYLLAGYKGKKIKKIYHNKLFNLIKINCIIENKKLGTGGALSLLKDKVKNNFVLMNGDSFVDIDLSFLFKRNLDYKFEALMFLIKNFNYKNNNKLAKLSLTKDQIVSCGGKYMNSGIYYFKNKILKNIPKKQISLENSILKKLIKNKKVKGKKIKSNFIDIGTYKSLEFAKKNFYKEFIKPAIFLDRDGVINHDYGYVHKIQYFKLKRGIIKTIKFLNEKKYNIFIITNQAGIARGYYSEAEFISFSKKIKEIFFNKGCFINDLQYCPYLKGSKIKRYNKQSSLRKPGNKMIENLKKKWPIKQKSSFMIGDQIKDQICARRSKIYFEFPSNNIFKQVKYIIKNINNYY
jgi:D-glycero-D-manno-heptose 1,7-bisphosphate phosphatase